VVSGILRLATKYIIDTLRSRALAHLSIAWPSTLKGWDMREDLARRSETDISLNSRFYPHPIVRRLTILPGISQLTFNVQDVINLAREVDAPSVLPAAFYDLSRYPYSEIFENTDDDSVFRPLPLCSSNLSTVDMQRLCLGKELSQQSITSLIKAMGESQHVRGGQIPSHSQIRKPRQVSVCVSAAACRKDFSELVDLATQHYLFDRERGCYDPLYVAEELGQLKSSEFSECKACAKALEAWAAREREKIWRSVFVWFRLE
jgi:hypothetical protein